LFSEKLDTDLNKIEWTKSSAMFSIYGSGASTNALVWINSDTLFVMPDQRLALLFGATMGFQVSVLSQSGKRSDTVDVVAPVVTEDFYVKWTNTKDNMGNVRQDLTIRDSVVVISSKPIQQIRGISGIGGKTVPPDLSLDNISLRGSDTIVYKPTLFLKPDSTYGLDFDIIFTDGSSRNDALGVSWKTALSLQILSYSNRDAGGFRPFRVIGDSLVVAFSSAIDTGINAVVPFKVGMIDVRYRTLKTKVIWNSLLTVATIFNIDTLPTADFDASPAYSGDAINTRAVNSVTFDLVTKEGEQVFGFKPRNEEIEIHTEKGFCVINTNILGIHDIRNRVERGERPTSEFPNDGSVTITFNREIDTMLMKADTLGLANYAGLKDGSTVVNSTISFSADSKTLIITSTTNLTAATNYYVWLKNIPAKRVSDAPAINIDAGRFSGKSSNYNLLDKAFIVK
jgi:hypothetical protein